MQTRPFQAELREQDGMAIIDLHGELDGFADTGLTEVYQAAERNNPSAVLLNFGDVDYINSTGIALIVGLLAQARKSRRPILTCGLSDHYQEIFRITRLSDFMTIVEDEASAIQQMSG
jgi:anti-anti-sigma factor